MLTSGLRPLYSSKEGSEHSLVYKMYLWENQTELLSDVWLKQTARYQSTAQHTADMTHTHAHGFMLFHRMYPTQKCSHGSAKAGEKKTAREQTLL